MTVVSILKDTRMSPLYIYFLYVDIMLVASKDKYEIRKLKAQLNKEFEMKDLETTKELLGM